MNASAHSRRRLALLGLLLFSQLLTACCVLPPGWGARGGGQRHYDRPGR